MPRVTAALFALLCVAVPACGQSTPQKQPQVHINYLNVCTPSEEEATNIAAALAMIPAKPAFDVDFEVSRGRSTMPAQPSPGNTITQSAPVSTWVRLRREFVPSAAFANAQYAFSVDEKGMAETLSFRTRDAGKTGILQISMDDSVTVGTPGAVLARNTPASRVRVERSGKSSLVLARCEGADQSKYDALFRQASGVLARYRTAMGARTTVLQEIRKMQPETRRKSAPAIPNK